MRFYRIIISDPTSGQTTQEFASVLSDGTNDPGALNIELDLAVTNFAEPLGGTEDYVRIWGPSLKQVGQQADLNGKLIKVFGGMGKGLPLATIQARQQGLLVSGMIQQAFANWIGTDMTLDLMIQAAIGSTDAPINLSLNWTAGTKLSDAIASTLSIAFPGYQQNIAISDRLVKSSDQPGVYSTMTQMALFIKQASISVLNDDTYPGVDIVLRDRTFYVFDGTSPTQPKNISFLDLIGQPTWIDSPAIQVTTTMRADLAVGDYVKMPPGLVTSTPQSLSQFKDATAFQGTFRVNQVRHVGNFRQAQAEAWASIFDCAPAATS